MGIGDLFKSNDFKNFFQGFQLVDKRLVRRRLFGLGLGQILSLMIAGTAIFSQLLVEKGVNIPTSQSTLNYFLLSFYMIVLWKRGVLWDTIKTKSKFLLPLAIVDVEANYVVVKAYQYTSITSIMLLDCFTIPCVVVLSRIFLKTRFTFIHIIAVVLSIIGMVILVISDVVQGAEAGGGSNPVLGDLLTLLSSVLYAISNVGQESTVKKYDRITYLSMIGLYGTIASIIQVSILERKEIGSMVWNGPIVGYLLGFAICLFIMYSFTPMMMEVAGATMMNLSILSSDIFGVIAAKFLFNRQLSWLYFLSFVVIMAGLVLYNISQPHVKSAEIKNLIDDNSSNTNYNESNTQDDNNNNNNNNNDNDKNELYINQEDEEDDEDNNKLGVMVNDSDNSEFSGNIRTSNTHLIDDEDEIGVTSDNKNE